MKSLDDLIRDAMAQALHIVRDPGAVHSVRERAADLIAAMLHEIGDVTEADVTDVLSAAGVVLDVGRHTARTLAAAAISLAPDRDRVLAGVSRLTARAFDEGCDRAGCDLTIVLLRAGRPCPEEWATRSLEYAFAQHRRGRGVSLLRAWLDRPLPADAEWLVAAVQRHAEWLLRYPLLRDDHLKAIQIATPSVAGWLELLKRAEEIEHPPITAKEFGANLDRARETLEQAMDQTIPGGRITLATWLVRLVGDAVPAVEATGV